MKTPIMKLTISLFFALTFASCVNNKKTSESKKINDPCKAIMDSARVMAASGEMTTNWHPTTPNYARANSVAIWMQNRPYNELKCLLESDNKLFNIFGYVNAGQYFMDSLDRYYSSLLDDTTSIQFVSKTGLVDGKITVGKLLTKMKAGMLEDQKDWNKRPLIEEKVQSFIKEYAKFPGSYRPKGFPYFSIGSETGRGRTDYRIRHHYEIKNNQENVVKVTSEFVFDAKLNLNVVAEDSTNTYHSIPPMLSDWLLKYGRPLNSKDSIDLKLR